MALTTADRIEIGELIARFAHFSDYGDWDALAACFTDDVVTSIAGRPAFVGIAAQVTHARNSAEWTQNQNRHLAQACYFLWHVVVHCKPARQNEQAFAMGAKHTLQRMQQRGCRGRLPRYGDGLFTCCFGNARGQLEAGV